MDKKGEGNPTQSIPELADLLAGTEEQIPASPDSTVPDYKQARTRVSWSIIQSRETTMGIEQRTAEHIDRVQRLKADNYFLEDQNDELVEEREELRELLADRDEMIHDYELLCQRLDEKSEAKDQRILELETGLRVGLEHSGMRYETMAERIAALKFEGAGLKDEVARLERLTAVQEGFCELADGERDEAFEYAHSLVDERNAARVENGELRTVVSKELRKYMLIREALKTVGRMYKNLLSDSYALLRENEAADVSVKDAKSECAVAVKRADEAALRLCDIVKGGGVVADADTSRCVSGGDLDFWKKLFDKYVTDLCHADEVGKAVECVISAVKSGVDSDILAENVGKVEYGKYTGPFMLVADVVAECRRGV